MPNPLIKGTDTQAEIKSFTIVREVLHNQWHSQNRVVGRAQVGHIYSAAQCAES